MKKLSIIPLLLLAFGIAKGQDGDTSVKSDEELTKLKGTVESLTESYLETKGIADKLNKIKVSGYIQPQWQYADSNGVASVAGGNFAANSQQRFLLRRARLKTTYENVTSRYVLQFDVAQSGLAIKDAYATIMEPWLKAFSATMGVFDRPFGFEISYSSSMRESPERSRVFQTMFPGERDLGAKLEIAPPSNWGFAQYLNFKGGVFTGLRENIAEIDNEQDLIGRIGFQAPFYDINLAIDGGFSAYIGQTLTPNDTVFKMMTNAAGADSIGATTGNRLKTFDRNIMGVDAQLYYDLPVLGGLSLRGEYLWGENPGTRSSSGPYLNATTAMAVREFMGWYVIWVQNLGSKLQTVVKYDVYDPNTAVEGSDVGKSGRNLNTSDVGFSTLGLGLLYHWDENVRMMAYYDLITNEETSFAAGNAAGSWNEDLNDNVFTFRMQVKF